MENAANPSPPPTPTPARQPKFQRRAESRPDEVLDAAADLFQQQGFDRTTVAQIAARAGLSKGAVYLYFPSKQAILMGLVRRALVPVADIALDAVAGHRGDPRPVIRQVMTVLAARLEDPQVLRVPKLILREAATDPGLAQTYRQEVLDRVLPALTALLAQGVAGGHIRAIDPEMTVRSIIGPVMAHLVLAEVFAIEPQGGLGLARLIENHLTILFAGLEPEKGTP